MSKIGPDHYFKLIKLVEPIRDKAFNDKKSIYAIYQSFVSTNDARITAFSKLMNILSSLQLSLTFIWKYLMRKNWWREIDKKVIPVKDLKIYVREFENFSKIGFVQLMFSAVESSFRLFLRALDPVACQGSTSSFRNIYMCLLKSKLSTYSPESIKFLDLFRHLRNTIHNNGVFFDGRGRNIVVIWRKVKYEFIHGAPLKFVTWDFLMEISDTIRELLKTVALDSNLQAFKQEIPDPFAQPIISSAAAFHKA
jgi:hypothetical protein